MATYYRGTRTDLTTLEPQPIPEGDRHRYPPNVERVVFASTDKTEAEIYALFSQRGLGGFVATPNESGKWSVTTSLSAAQLQGIGNEKVYIYTIEDNDGLFKKPIVGDEFYATETVVPSGKETFTVREILEKWEREATTELTLGFGREQDMLVG